jgi:hypothetical protein
MELLKRPGRRRFLVGAGVAGATAAWVAASGANTLQRVAQPPSPAESGRRGMSEHIRKYYRTTRI